MKKIIGVLLLIAISILSGCVTNTEDDTQSSAVNNSVSDKPANPDVTDVVTTNDKISVKSGDTDTNTVSGTGPGWCTPGATISIKDSGDFVITGIGPYTAKDGSVRNGVCIAEKSIPGGKSVVYFNEGYVNNGKDKFIAVESTASGSGAHASSSAIVTSNK